MTHRTILSLGHRGCRVRVYVEGSLVRVRWRVSGVRRHQSWPNTPENRTVAKEFAHGILDEQRHPTPVAPLRLTLRQLWDRYEDAEFPSLRQKSKDRYLERWRKWERFLGREAIAEDATQENVDQYRAARADQGIVVNQVAEEVKMVKVVYAWGQRRRLIARNDVGLYRFKIAKEDRPEPPAEYRVEDLEKILATFDPSEWGQWRPWALLTLLGNQGVRTNAARHLQWADVDLDGKMLTWRPQWDKLGNGWTQPMREATRLALGLCQIWRIKLAYTGPWVFFSADSRRAKRNHEPVYGHAALAAALAKAEKIAGVPHMELRAMHGLRRMVVGEIVKATGGDLVAAADFINDKDLRVVRRSYNKRRDDQLKATATALDRGVGVVKLAEGVEPSTAGLRNQSSTTELRQQAPRKVHQSATGTEVRGVTGFNEDSTSGFEPTTAPLTHTKEHGETPPAPSHLDQGPTPPRTPPTAERHPESTTEAQSPVVR